MNKREAKFGIAFRKWLKANPMESALFELKQTTTSRLSFSAVKPHQIDWLRAAKSKYGALYKPPDNQGVPLPCDYLYVREGGGWIVIKYPEIFCVMDVDKFVELREKSAMKSLSMQLAAYHSTHVQRY